MSDSKRDKLQDIKNIFDNFMIIGFRIDYDELGFAHFIITPEQRSMLLNCYNKICDVCNTTNNKQ